MKKYMQIKFKRLNERAEIPMYAKDGDAGLDLVATSIKFTDDYVEYGTGIAVEIPAGYVGMCFPRSSITKLPSGVSLKNSCGIIDSGYRGEITARLELPIDRSRCDALPQIGDRIVQLIIIPYPQIEMIETDVLSDSDRGTGGYGSTGV